jgi:hypothetical protein
MDRQTSDFKPMTGVPAIVGFTSIRVVAEVIAAAMLAG